MSIEFNDVTRIYNTGGSMLRTSKQQLQTSVHVDNCLRVLQHHRVRYLVTIGGTQTAYSASLVVSAAAAAKYKLSVVHVPKTIFNDLPLGDGVTTFGFSTAREVGCQLVQNFANDARTMLRWYILVCMGQVDNTLNNESATIAMQGNSKKNSIVLIVVFFLVFSFCYFYKFDRHLFSSVLLAVFSCLQKAGHLTLGIGKAGASTVTIIAEDYMNRTTPLTFAELATVLEAAIYKVRHAAIEQTTLR